MRTTTLILLGAAAAVQAHMQLEYPAPFNASNNPHLSGPFDDKLVYPQGCCDQDDTAICRGYLSLLGTPAGASVATWTAGSNITWNITGSEEITGFVGGGTHYGGSCQVGFSIDNGTSFQVAASYEGNCPRRNSPDDSGQNFDLTIPADLPAGDAVFAWAWVNREQEFFMDCAAVTIVGGNSSDSNSSSSSTSTSTSTNSVAARSSTSAESSTASSSAKTFELEWCSCNCTTTTETTDDKDAYDADGCTCQCWKAPTALDTTKRDAHMARHVHRRSNDASIAASQRRDTGTSAWMARPQMLIPSNPIYHNPALPKTTAELKYPEPGPQVVPGDGEYPLQEPSST